MSCINRIWVAAGVAAVNGHSDQGQKLKSGLRSLNGGKNRFFSDAADSRPFPEAGGFVGGGGRCGEEQRKQAEESVRQVMYMNCWGQG